MKHILENFRISHVPLKPAVLVSPDMSLSEALKKMREERIGCVVSVEDKIAKGIFTERDFLNKILGKDIKWSRPISDFTSENPVVMSVDQPLIEAFEHMKTSNFRHIPIKNVEDEIRGILSIRRIIELVAEHFPADVLNLPPRLSQHPSSREGG